MVISSEHFSHLGLVTRLEVSLATSVVLDELCFPPDNSTLMSSTLPSGSTSIGSVGLPSSGITGEFRTNFSPIKLVKAEVLLDWDDCEPLLIEFGSTIISTFFSQSGNGHVLGLVCRSCFSIHGL